jgi:CTP synthase
MQTKYIFVTGGVVSSLGKGLTAASIGMLLEKRGLNVAMLKLDPYLNVDPGTMSPFQHGEVYVTDDGAETDLDLGHYYRFTNTPLSKASNTTSGQIFNAVIKRERRGDYLGKTVQFIPHITNEIKSRILKCSMQKPDTDVVIVEIGGTIGDIESLTFLEAIRQFRNESPEDCLNIHLTYVPYLAAAGEVKTKPTQHSVQSLRQIGINPDIIVCRCEKPLDEDIKDKISQFCNVSKSAVIDEPDVEFSIYEVPVQLKESQIDLMVCKKLNIEVSLSHDPDLSSLSSLVETIKKPKGTISIGIVGKYIEHQDAYKSVFESLEHAALNLGYLLDIRRILPDSLHSVDDCKKQLEGCVGCLVPGGFGERGWEGKIFAAQYCREQQLPYFGICLGMQVLAVEFARNVAGLKGANSTECQVETSHPIISLLSEQKGVQDLGGTMRLGSYPCILSKGSKAFEAYGSSKIFERHRHRYEFNHSYKNILEEKGLNFSGTLEGGIISEITEVADHPWMVGVQFHPEFKSKPTKPHPLFLGFTKAMIKNKETVLHG